MIMYGDELMMVWKIDLIHDGILLGSDHVIHDGIYQVHENGMI
jgi:hypothetical protein